MRPTFEKLCQRLRELRLFGVMERRVEQMGAACKGMLADVTMVDTLITLAVELALAAAAAVAAAPPGGGGADIRKPVPGAAPMVDVACQSACVGTGGEGAVTCTNALPLWPAVLEAVLGYGALLSLAASRP
jgi:hypothetical protein